MHVLCLMPCTVCLLDLVNVNLFMNLDISCMCESCSRWPEPIALMFSSIGLKSLCTCALGVWIYMHFKWSVWCHGQIYMKNNNSMLQKVFYLLWKINDNRQPEMHVWLYCTL
jgi:hypothetical protein